MKIFLFIMIVFSGSEISGYPLVDVLLLAPYLFLFFTSKLTLGTFKISLNWVTLFCIYMVFQVLRGMYFLNDFRMIYWLLFFTIVYFSHLFLNSKIKGYRATSNFTETIFNYSVIYFIIYGLIGFFIKNPDHFQGIYWVGSSVAFVVIIPLLFSHFILFKNSKFSLSGFRIPSLLVLVLASIIHESRTGLYLFSIYLFMVALFLFIRKPNRLILIFSFILFVIGFWDFSTRGFGKSDGLASTIEKFTENSEEVSDDLGRIIMVQAVFDKFINSPIDFFIGTGWYTSRENLKPYIIILRKQFGLKIDHLSSNVPLQVIGLAAIICDTGLIGLIFVLSFFLITSKQIVRNFGGGSVILISILSFNWLFYMVGYTFVSILSILIFVPNGIFYFSVLDDQLAPVEKKIATGA